MYHITYNLSFPVNNKYRAAGEDEYTLDPSKTRVVSQAVENAKRIVNDASGMSDYKKLVFYKDRICELVEYGSDSFSTDCSPWTLVNVFDMIDTTDAVCEGYSEAFQYLCDLTDFDSADTYAYSVRGTMSGGTGAGRHKWNIVHIGGNNYIADITNSDKGTAGQRGQLFLTGAKEGTYDSTYTFEWPDYQEQVGNYIYTYYGSTIVYTYSDDTKSSYTPAQLTLSTTNYSPSSQQEVNLDDIVHPVGMDLALKDDIAMNLYVETEEGLQSGDKIVITVEGKDPVEQLISEADTTTKTDYHGKEYEVSVFTVELNAKEMTDEVTLQVKRGDKTGAIKRYSVVSYARAILEGSYSTKAKNLCRAMLNYGAYAQKYFDHNTSTLANADLSNDSTNGKITFEGLSLSLKSKVTLRLYFKGVAINESTLSCDDGSVDVSLETLDSGYQVVVVKGITADKIDQGFQIEFTTGSGSFNIFISPMYYCYKASSGEYGDKLADLVKALYLYNVAADSYVAA